MIHGKNTSTYTNKDARDYKILRCKVDNISELEEFIPSKKETVVGGLDFLDNYIIRGEKSDATKNLCKKYQKNQEEEIRISNEKIGVPGVSLIERLLQK